ncbi:atp adenylyltransferase [Stylonychia lemnae]|uniref:Atp adenylyltransferase n=1 Tax=Stylonychia lemnae TaxID=5949 RepID=A0A078APS5_STYLE|nr:atp adenylyltransferase [Stylonychia lemnae]|eukprot:CDW83302.1 atp adenylyltransferase [Stylonychia lemnae]
MQSELSGSIKDIKFPKKTLFKMRNQVIKQREEALQQFMNALCNSEPKYNLFIIQNDQFCEFIKIDEDIRNLLIEQYISTEKTLSGLRLRGTFVSRSRSNLNSLVQPSSPAIQHQSIRQSFQVTKESNFEQTVFDFLFLLNQNNEEKENIVKQRGILHFIGNIETHPIMSKACLCLVNKLLNYQQNKHAEKYNKIFARTETGLIRAMKLEIHMKERNKLVTNQQVMLILDSYLKSNPRVKDIRLLLGDQEACDLFSKWYTVRKNYKDMNLCEPKNIKRSKQSFRKSKSSYVSGISDEDTTHQGTLNHKRIQGTVGTMGVCEEDPLENFSDQFTQLEDRESIGKRQNDKLKEIKRSMSKDNNQEWIFSHIIDNDIKVFTNERQQELLEFQTQIEYDNMSLDLQQISFIVQILESEQLKFIPEGDSDNCEENTIYYIHFNDEPLMRVNIQIKDQLQSIFVQISQIDKNNQSKIFLLKHFLVLSDYIIILFSHSEQSSHDNLTCIQERYQLVSQMHVVDEEIEQEDEEEKHPQVSESKHCQNHQNSSSKSHQLSEPMMQSSDSRDQINLPYSSSGGCANSSQQKLVNVRMIVEISDENIKQQLSSNSRTRLFFDKLRGDQNSLEQRCSNLKKKIYKMYPNNKSLIYIQTNDSILKQIDIPFVMQTVVSQVKLPPQQQIMNSTDSSGQGNHTSQIASEKLSNSSTYFRKSDVFLEPFESGICIDDSLTKTHRLIFNKFPSRPYHVLVITKEKEKQGDVINIRDFEASLIPMKALEGIVFYNSGIKAGASQSHKHLQVLPIKSLPNKKIPIHQRVLEEIKRHKSNAKRQDKNDDSQLFQSFDENLFILSEYQQMRHTFCWLETSYFQNIISDKDLKKSAQYYRDAYQACLKKIGNADGQLPYNFVVTPEWMFMVIRQKPHHENIPCNSLGYLGLMYAKNEEQRDKIVEIKPIEMLKELAAPMDFKQ